MENIFFSFLEKYFLNGLTMGKAPLSGAMLHFGS